MFPQLIHLNCFQFSIFPKAFKWKKSLEFPKKFLLDMAEKIVETINNNNNNNNEGKIKQSKI